MFLGLKQNRIGHSFKDDRDVEAVVTGWLVTLDRDSVNRGQHVLFHDVINASMVARTVWKISRIAVQWIVNCSYWR
jgi:hypothetical protein